MTVRSVIKLRGREFMVPARRLMYYKIFVRARIVIADCWQQVEQTVAQPKIADPLPPEPSKYIPISDASAKDYSGAMVRFGPGAEVSDVKFASDFSTIHISGLPVGASAEVVVKLLEDLGFSVSKSCVLVRSIGNAGPVAEVKIEDPMFAKAATNKFEEDSKRGRHRGLSIRPVLGNVSTGALANRLRMSSVICTWYAPSRVAWLQYREARAVSRAMEVLEASPRILNRKIECTMQSPPPFSMHSPIWSIRVGNLDVLTNEGHFNRILTGVNRPHKVVIGRPSHPLSEAEAAKMVESTLQGKGDLESFQYQATAGSVKLKATATFMDRGQAVDAVQSLNNHKLEALGNSKLFVSHLISVKYPVLNVICDLIGTDLGRLRDDIWQRGHVHLKSYPSMDPTKPLTTIRIFGEDSKCVAEANDALKKLLAGSIVLNGESTVWDPFFTTPAALDYLKQESNDHKLYVHRDIRKSYLLLYGGSANDRTAVQQALIAKVESLQQLTHKIVLTSELLPKAMKGGWRRIKERFSEAAALDISRQPKTIVIQGSATDFQLARALLLQNESTSTEAKDSQEDNMCPVCWDEAVEPLKMPCGHIYCKDCFHLQASSADDSSFPVRCCGAEGKCSRIFSLDELKMMLSPAALEKLLVTSFETFVRTHPKNFQHCPTPDCPNIYRITKNSSVIPCSGCLFAICTTCNVISHDGMSCAEFTYLDSEENKASEAFMKETDTRKCPKCSTLIQKTCGCNHMECACCKTHICWFCMRIFDASTECYNHMQSVHHQIDSD
jgi:hypothetical protein